MAEVSTRLFYADEAEYDRVGREAYPILRDGLVYVTEVRMRRRDGSVFTARLSGRASGQGPTADVIWVFEDVTARVEAEEARARAIRDLEDALANVRTLSGLLPICMYCKRIRNDDGYWDRIEKYVSEHTTAQFSHGMCPECFAEHVDPALGVIPIDASSTSGEFGGDAAPTSPSDRPS